MQTSGQVPGLNKCLRDGRAAEDVTYSCLQGMTKRWALNLIWPRLGHPLTNSHYLL